jgi:hypothetical protein
MIYVKYPHQSSQAFLSVQFRELFGNSLFVVFEEFIVVMYFLFQNVLSCGTGSQPCSSIDYAVSRLAGDKGIAKISVKGRTDVLNPVKLDNIIMTTDGVVREVYVQSASLQTPGQLYITESKVGEVENIKFVLSPLVSSKPFFHSVGGTIEAPVTLRSCTFTTTAGSAGSLGYSVLEIAGGTALIIGCTFSDLKMNPTLTSDNTVVIVKKANITLKNSVFANIQLDTGASILGSAGSQCEWGLYSVVVLHEAVTLIKDVMVSNTFAGVTVHGGTAMVEGTNFTVVGSDGSFNYPSVERHMQCGMKK